MPIRQIRALSAGDGATGELQRPRSRTPCPWGSDLYLVPILLFYAVAVLGSGLAAAGEATSRPFFEFRGWETQVDGLWCTARGESTAWYKNSFYLSYLDTVLQEAPRYNANALILMGRGDNAEIHTFVTYRKWPLLNALYENRRRDDHRRQTRQLIDLIEKASRQGVAVYLWDHEVHIPSELPKLYPSVAGTASNYCPCSPDLARFMADKYEEFLDRVPGIAGVFLVLSETQSVLLDGSPCTCDVCRRSKPEELLERIIRAIEPPLKKRHKRLVVRTFGHSIDQERAIITAINRLPSDLDVAVMSKSTSCDFYGFRYPPHPAIGGIKGRTQYVEEAFGEYRGKTHIINTPAEFYHRTIRLAADNGLKGVVVRLDHNGFPKSNFDTPNRFNIHFVSKLWQDPNADPNAIWSDWFGTRYGEEAARWLIPAIKDTERLWDGSTNTLGVYTASAHGNLAPIFHGPYCAWDNLDCSVFRVTRGIAPWDHLGDQLLRPTDDTLARIAVEIDECNRLANSILDRIRQASTHLKPKDSDELLNYGRSAARSAEMFGHLKMLFFLGLQAEQSTGRRRSDKVRDAFEESTQAIRLARRIEQESGRDAWPLVPDDGRGSPFYHILTDYWTHCIPRLTENAPLIKGWGTPLSFKDSPAARLYATLLEAARPAHPPPGELTLDWNADNAGFRLEQDRVIFTHGNRDAWACPLAIPTELLAIPAGTPTRLKVLTRGDRLRVIPEPLCDIETSILQRQKRELQQDRLLRSSIRDAAGLNAYKSRVRQRFLETLGPLPERTPLEARITGTLVRDGYRIEKVLFQSRPNFYVTVNLYIPTSRPGPMPAMLCPLGHAPDGKAHNINDSYQAIFITMARKGYVVCAYDPLGQGEREPYGAPTGNHHMIQGFQCMPTGRHLAQYFIWDGIRCIDYLETRPEVDARRIGCSGCSGGGTLTHYITALDDRVAVSIPASWVIESIPLTRDTGLHTESWLLDVCAPHGPGTDQLLACIAPRPLLILGNSQDGEFPPASMAASYREAKKLYDALGLGDRVEYANVPTPHGYWPEARRELYRFANRWLGQADQTADEPPFTPERKEDLYAAPGGQVRNISGARTVYDLNRAWMAELRQQRELQRKTLSTEAYRSSIWEGVRSVSHYRRTTPSVTAQALATHPTDAPGSKSMLFEYQPGFATQADLYVPAHPKPNAPTVVLIADDNAKVKAWAGRLSASGVPVFHLHTEKANPRHEIMGGSPRCGRWAAMVLRGASYLLTGDRPRTSSVALMGVGWHAALSVQFAAILEPSLVSAVISAEGLGRVESLSEDITESNEYQMALPAALRHFDESDLAAAVAPTPLLIMALQDKKGNALSQADAVALNAWATETCKAFGSPSALRISAAPLSAESVVRWLTAQRPKEPPVSPSGQSSIHDVDQGASHASAIVR